MTTPTPAPCASLIASIHSGRGESMIAQSLMTNVNNILNLPPDCKAHICSFLSLHECIFSYGLQCLQALEDIVPDLVRRRYQFLKSFTIPTRTKPCKNYIVHSLTPKDRISCLYNSLPKMHYLRPFVKKLCEDLHSFDQSNHSNESQTSSRKLKSTLDCINRALHAHKLHCFILSASVTINSHALCQIFNFNEAQPSTIQIQSRSEVTMTIEEYIGNVMIATFLMSNLDFVDGGIIQNNQSESNQELEFQNIPNNILHIDKAIKSEVHFIRQTLTLVRLDSLCAEYWFRAWILLHSSLLRVMPFDPEQQNNLGIVLQQPTISFPISSHLTSCNPTYLPSTNFPYIFAPQSEFTCSELFRVVKALRDIIGSCNPCFNIRDFGPLGPSFRGRDRLRLLHVNAGVTCTVLMKILHYFRDHYRDCNEWKDVDSNFIMRATLDLEWMYDVHRETFRRRPMTVIAPTVRFMIPFE